MNEIATVLLPGVAASVGALLSALAGTRLGLHKYRQERSYDAQINWHRSLAETVKVLSNRSRNLRYLRGHLDRPEEILTVVQNVGELAFKFQELAEQASLYAKKDTFVAIRNSVDKLNALAPQFENPPERCDVPHPYDLSIAGLDVIYDLVARDLRELLGLEPL